MALTSINHSEKRAGSLFRAFSASSALALLSSTAAQAVEGHASRWQLGLQKAASPVAEFIGQFHDGLLFLITAVTLFVLALLVIFPQIVMWPLQMMSR